MAYSVIETKIANPASGGHKMAKKTLRKKKLSAKQIAAGFGGSRRKAALKTNRAKKRSNPPKKHASKKVKAKSNAAPKKHLKKAKKSASHKKAKRKNPTPEIISFVMGNPARKGHKKTMAKPKYKKKKSASKSNAGAHHHKKKTMTKKRHNPAGFKSMDLLMGSGVALASGVATRLIPQMAGSANTGPMGYALNIGTTVAAMLLAHSLTKKPLLTFAAGIGGGIALFIRIATDYTPYGQQLSLSGFGDYMASNWVTPQRIINPNSAMWEVPSGWGQMPAALPPAGMMAQSGADARTSGNSY